MGIPWKDIYSGRLAIARYRKTLRTIARNLGCVCGGLDPESWGTNEYTGDDGHVWGCPGRIAARALLIRNRQKTRRIKS